MTISHLFIHYAYEHLGYFLLGSVLNSIATSIFAYVFGVTAHHDHYHKHTFPLLGVELLGHSILQLQ